MLNAKRTYTLVLSLKFKVTQRFLFGKTYHVMLIHSWSKYGKQRSKDKEFLACHQRMLKNPNLTLRPKVKIKYRSSLFATPNLVMIHLWSKCGKLTEKDLKLWTGQIKSWQNIFFPFNPRLISHIEITSMD